MEIRHSTVNVYVYENGIWPFQDLLILRNINIMTLFSLLRQILREPVFSGQPVLSGHLEESRGCPVNTGLTVNVIWKMVIFNQTWKEVSIVAPWLRIQTQKETLS